MNTVTSAVLPDMLNSAQMTVLERQQARQKWHQQDQQQQESYFNEAQLNMSSLLASTPQDQFQSLINSDTVIRDFVNRTMKLDPCLDNGWPDFAKYQLPGTGIGIPGFGVSGVGTVDYSISRTASCPPEVRGGEICLPAASKKRKAQNSKVCISYFHLSIYHSFIL